MSDQSNLKKPILKDEAYNFTKNAVLIYLPAFATLYLTLASIWNLPYSTEVVATASALAVFLGAIVKVSANRYSKIDNTDYSGVLTVNTKDPEKDVYHLAFDVPYGDIQNKDSVTFKVNNEDQNFTPHV